MVRRAADLLATSPTSAKRSATGAGSATRACGSSDSAAVRVASSSSVSSPWPNRAFDAATTAAHWSAPCTSVVSSSASARCAARACGRSSVSFSSSSSSSRLRKLRMRVYRETSRSSTFSQNW